MKTEKYYVNSNGRRIKLLVLRPTKHARASDMTAGVFWIHGGGFATGMAEMVYITRDRALVEKFGVTVCAPAYTLSWQAPYPAAIEDCYAALLWFKANAWMLGYDPERIIVGGESAGGGLCAALCMLARDRGEVDIKYQFPLYPMLDDRDTPSSRDNHAHVWNTRRNHAAWKLYLRDKYGTDSVPPYAAPARQDNYVNLQPCYTFVGDIEPFYCETLNYVNQLKAAGVPAECDVYPGCWHAFDMLAPWKRVSREAAARFEQKFAEALEKCAKGG